MPVVNTVVITTISASGSGTLASGSVSAIACAASSPRAKMKPASPPRSAPARAPTWSKPDPSAAVTPNTWASQ